MNFETNFLKNIYNTIYDAYYILKLLTENKDVVGSGDCDNNNGWRSSINSDQKMIRCWKKYDRCWKQYPVHESGPYSPNQACPNGRARPINTTALIFHHTKTLSVFPTNPWSIFLSLCRYMLKASHLSEWRSDNHVSPFTQHCHHYQCQRCSLAVSN